MSHLSTKKEIRRLSAVEKGYADLPDDVNEIEMIEMIANAIGEPFKVVHQRFLDIKSKK